ncbi:MAG: hypothetical protein WBP81_31385 [Solirubrobacteraceae bacterium]
MSKQVKQLLDWLTGLPHAESRAKPLSATHGVLEAAGTSGVKAGFDAQVIPSRQCVDASSGLSAAVRQHASE